MIVTLFSNSSISGIFLASLLLALSGFYISGRKAVKIATGVGMCVLLALVLLSESRSGWLGLLAGGAFILYRSIARLKQGIIIILSAAFICLLTSFLFFYKKNSTSGRWHIYHVSLIMLKDHWVTGTGPGQFKARFNEYQAGYFSTRSIDSKRALLADNTFYAFNDYLQWVIETGLAGLFSGLIFLYLIIRKIGYLYRENRSIPLINGVTAALICIAVAALFSYPLQAMPVQALALLLLTVISFYPLRVQTSQVWKMALSFLFKGIVLAMLATFSVKAWNENKARQMEKKAFQLNRSGYKAAALGLYQSIIEQYPAAGYNWYFYAQLLFNSNQPGTAYQVLNEGMRFYVDNRVYRLKAEIEKETGQYAEAEKSYLRAIYMVPNRMSSRLDLMHYYCDQKDTAKAMYWASSILQMPVKVPSEKTSAMLKEVKQVLAGFQ